MKILSIHRSKGLEYSVVFLCGLGRRINYGDLQKPVLFHPRLGLGPKGLDRETMVEFTTLARTGVALALKKELLAEEMRLLYVAMTRAKEKLILTHALAYGRGRPEEPGGECLLPRRPPGAGGVHQCGSVAPAHCAGPAGGGRTAGGHRPGGASLPAAAWGHPGALPTMAAGCPRGVLPPWSLQGGAACRSSAGGAPRAAALALSYEASAATPAKVAATQVADQDPEEAGWFLLRDQGSRGRPRSTARNLPRPLWGSPRPREGRRSTR